MLAYLMGRQHAHGTCNSVCRRTGATGAWDIQSFTRAHKKEGAWHRWHQHRWHHHQKLELSSPCSPPVVLLADMQYHNCTHSFNTTGRLKSSRMCLTTCRGAQCSQKLQ